MQLTLLQTLFIVAGTVIFLVALDSAKRRRFTFLHIFAFLGSAGGLIIFSFFPRVLDALWVVMGTQRGADVLVYWGILFLMYFSLFLLRRVENTDAVLVQTIRALALREASVHQLDGLIFLLRAYNEASVMEDTVCQLLTTFPQVHILFVDDGSTDATRPLALRLSGEFSPRMTVISHAKNQGAGAALETGFEYIRRNATDHTLVITIDPDGQHDIADIPKFLESMKDTSVGFAIGSRFIPGGSAENIPLGRRVILFLGKIFTLLISRIYVTDSHNGFRAFRVSTIRSIRLTLSGFAYASELIDEIARTRTPFREIPVTIRYTPYSLSKGQKSSNALKIAIGMVWKKFF